MKEGDNLTVYQADSDGVILVDDSGNKHSLTVDIRLLKRVEQLFDENIEELRSALLADVSTDLNDIFAELGNFDDTQLETFFHVFDPDVRTAYEKARRSFRAMQLIDGIDDV